MSAHNSSAVIPFSPVAALARRWVIFFCRPFLPAVSLTKRRCDRRRAGQEAEGGEEQLAGAAGAAPPGPKEVEPGSGGSGGATAAGEKTFEPGIFKLPAVTSLIAMHVAYNNSDYSVVQVRSPESTLGRPLIRTLLAIQLATRRFVFENIGVLAECPSGTPRVNMPAWVFCIS